VSGTTTSILVAALCGATALGFWVWLVAVPIGRSFDAGWNRVVGVTLSLFTLFTGLGIGAAIGLEIAYHWDSIAG
jgi:hypothetical protein